MTRTALISAIFASYVAIMFAIASIPGEATKLASQIPAEWALN